MRRPRRSMRARSPTSGCTARRTSTGSAAWAAPPRSGAAAACPSTRSISTSAATCRTAAGRSPTSDLLPYYPRANALAEAGRFSYDADDAARRPKPPMFRGFDSDVVRTDGLERFSCPTDFGRRYATPPARRAPTCRCCWARTARRCLDSGEARPIDSAGGRARWPATASSVAAARARARHGRAGNRAPAAGLARRRAAAGIGNEHDVVGRYYMCHIAGNVGTLIVHGHASRRAARLRSHARRRLLPPPPVASRPANSARTVLANAVARLHFPAHHRSRAPQRRAVGAVPRARAYQLRIRQAPATTARPRRRRLYARHLLQCHAPTRSTPAPSWRTGCASAPSPQRKFPSVILRNRTNRFSLEVHGEQLPRADSRVTLCDSADALGMPQLRVDWRYSASRHRIGAAARWT